MFCIKQNKPWNILSVLTLCLLKIFSVLLKDGKALNIDLFVFLVNINKNCLQCPAFLRSVW